MLASGPIAAGPKSELHRFLDANLGWLVGALSVAYLSWIVMPIKTARVWRVHRRKRARALEAAVFATTPRRRSVGRPPRIRT
jgi:uncharacterized membrane protein YccC